MLHKSKDVEVLHSKTRTLEYFPIAQYNLRYSSHWHEEHNVLLKAFTIHNLETLTRLLKEECQEQTNKL